MPFGFHLAMDTLPSEDCERMALGSAACFRLSLSCPFGFPHLPFHSGQRGITPAFGYGAPHSSTGGTSTLLNNALLSARYGPLRHPRAPGLSVTGVRLVVPDLALGLPVLRALSLCTCCRHYPGTATGGTASLIRPVMSAFPERVVGSACASSFSRLTQRSLTLRPAHSRRHLFVARLPEGFRHFVTSMPAPVASGWSGCRVGLAPTGRRRLVTAHTQCGTCQSQIRHPKADGRQTGSDGREGSIAPPV